MESKVIQALKGKFPEDRNMWGIAMIGNMLDAIENGELKLHKMHGADTQSFWEVFTMAKRCVEDTKAAMEE